MATKAKQAVTPATTDAQRWVNTITQYDREFKRWVGLVEKIIKIYRDNDRAGDARNGGSTTFNILWSNVQTCLPATFARLPKPDVSRRFRDNDPVGRVAALILERALEFEIEHYPDYRAAMEGGVLDRFLGGRGTAWVRYEPHFRAAETGVPEDGLQITENAEQEEPEEGESAEEVIDYECSPVDYVHWKDFGHTIARTWEEVTAVWRVVYMGRAGLVERFGEEIGNKVPLDTRPEDQKKYTADSDSYQACIIEIWDKTKAEALWISKSLGEILDRKPDPLELEGFFPCPRPLYATTTTDCLIPVPDYKLYQDQANELNTLADRIDGLIKALQVKGVYNSAVPELARLFTEGGSGDMIAVKNWTQFAEKNGLDGSIDLVDLAPIVAALNECYNSVAQVKNEIYEIMGIADIIRGSTDPNETLGAQKLKGQFGGMRLQAMQRKVGQYATEILQIKAQIICTYAPETLAKIAAVEQLSEADKPLAPQALEMLKSEPLRSFRIEVSADSMVQMDEQQEKIDRVEFLKGTSAFLKEALPMVQEAPQMAPLLVEMLKFGVGAFRVGKTIEGQFDQTLDQLKQAAANPQPKPPDPEMVKAQAAQQQMQIQAQLDQQAKQQESQLEQQRMAMEAHLEQQRQQNEMTVEQHKQEMQARQIEHQNQLEAQRAQLAADAEARSQQMQQMHEAALEQSRQQFELLITRLTNANKVEVAEVNKSAQLEKAQVAAANTASQDDTIKGLPDDKPSPAEPKA